MSTKANNYNCNFKYFLLLMQSVLNFTAAPKPDENINWQVLYDISVRHSLAGMLYYAIEKLPENERPQGEFMPYLRQMYQEQIVADLNLTFEAERMLAVLSAEGIRCLPVKGIITKVDYPVPSLRSMTDADILCDPHNRLKVEEIFLKNGYVRENVGEKDSSYRKDEILHFEMHTSLLKSDSPAYQYFSDVWDRVTYREDSLIAAMTLEDTYIFMLEHLANHVVYGGAGIRMYMDVYVFLKKHSTELNREYTAKVLKEICLSDFEKKTLSICHNWFSGEEEVDSDSYFSTFILDSCTFGRASVSFLSDTIRNYKDSTSATGNGLKRILKKLFPSVKWMRLGFKAVDKIPVLYPVFLPVHWFNRLFIKRNVNTSNLGHYFTSADSEEALKLKNIFTSLGLEKRI